MSMEVSDDPDLGPMEKETTIHWARDEKYAHVSSEEAAIIRWLLKHPDYEEKDRRVKDGVQHYTSGRLPVGAIKLSGHPRNSNQHSRVLGQLPEDDG